MANCRPQLEKIPFFGPMMDQGAMMMGKVVAMPIHLFERFPFFGSFGKKGMDMLYTMPFVGKVAKKYLEGPAASSSSSASTTTAKP